MKKIKDNWGYIVSLILLIIFIIWMIFDYTKKKNILQEYSKNFFYMDTYINVRIYSNNSKKANEALNEIDKIYSDYHKLVDRYNKYDNIKNIYYINNNDSDSEYLEIDSRLYDLIEYGLNAYKETNGLININMGELIDIWKTYREKESGVPSTEELMSANIDINRIKISSNKILNNHPNIDLGALAKGYVSEIVSEYLESVGFDKYLINAGGNVIVGNHYGDGEYKIGIEDPTDSNGIYEIIKGNNICITTSGDYQRYYDYNGVRYHHIIDPNTLYPSNYAKSVTVITKDGSLGDMLSTTLFLMSVDEGKEFIKKYDNVEAVWYTTDNETIKSEGFDKYEQK